MPELPEVERWRGLAERVAGGRRIVGVECADDPIVVVEASPREVERALAGRRVVGARRRGKYLWLELDARPWPLFHFGMAGGLRAPGEPDLELSSGAPGGRGDAWPPRFTKLHLRLDDGGALAFLDKRRLGRLRLREDPASESPVAALGFDPLLDLPPPRAFAAALTRRRAPVKGVLLDQSFAAGVGNWLADEVLYQARIDPRRRAADLAAAEVRRLHRALRHVVAKAVAVDAEKDRLPRTWLFHHRWGRAKDATTARGERIEHATVAGRTTAWVPSRQK